MNPLAIANQILQGVLLGGLYALFASGLSISVGVMRFVNIAHGDLIVLVSFLLFTLTAYFHVPLLLAVAISLPISFAGGYVLQRFLLQRVLGKGILQIVLVTFGISIIVQNFLQGTFGADTRRLSGSGFESASIPLTNGIGVGYLPLTIFAAAVLLIFALDRLLYTTRVGAHIRAVSDDVDTANLVGLSSPRIYAIAMGVVGVTVCISAAFMSVFANFDPTSGPDRLLTAFEAVVLGGLGSLWGTLIGGIIIGVAQLLGAQLLGSEWQQLAGHLVFLAIFLIRPQGLFPRY
ncbi:MAG TPA: branched-chain amino acid ABC transporter permease [Candidatus Sulfotelmatobacter sp.]|nr:branched-chain amino acid ABC transporter permease [Candidatus Sulfotelmatobacter sp.]